MGTHTIGEAARRSGFSTSALRYYEGIGLMGAVDRSGAGYRIYDDQALSRLAFVARAKRLGCSLPDIADLLAVWDAGRCGPVQRRLHELVTAELVTTGQRVDELRSFEDHLRATADHLGGEPVDGPCDAGCPCIAPTPSTPVACTLDPAALPARLDEWRSVLATATERRSAADGALHITFGDDVDLGDLARLIVAEQRCCPFFAFTLTVDHRGTALEVRAPEGAVGMVDEVFAAAP